MSRPLPLADLLPNVARIPPHLIISGLAQDSRAVRPGDAFIALAGSGNHGLQFAETALAAGAAAVLYEPPLADDTPAPPPGAIAVPNLRDRLGTLADRFHGAPSRALRSIAVSGTSGKTSIVQLLVQALERLGVRSGSIGTLGAGMHGALHPTGFTTPLVLQVHALLAGLRDVGAQAVAMEVSSHALDQGRVDGVHFDIAVFSNLTRDHLDYHGDMAAYAAAKVRLFTRDGLRAAVINTDDGVGRTIPGVLQPGVRAITVSAAGRDEADIAARAVNLNEHGLAFTLRIGAEQRPIRSPLLGRFNIDNLLLVAGVLLAEGHAIDTIAAVLPALEPIPGRMTRLGGHAGLPLVVVDYSHKPDPLEQALDSLRAHLRGRLTCVFGCGGERDQGKRALMAAIAERHAERITVTDDNPRGEDGDAIVADILAGFTDRTRVHVERDRARAITRAIAAAGSGDIVLIAGKGHETYQEIAGIRHPFDDREIARAALAAREVQA